MLWTKEASALEGLSSFLDNYTKLSFIGFNCIIKYRHSKCFLTIIAMLLYCIIQCRNRNAAP